MSHGRDSRPGVLPDPSASPFLQADARLLTRRSVLAGAALGACVLALPRPLRALASDDSARSLAFTHLHTGERLRATYWEEGRYVEGALREIDHLLRDHRTGDVEEIDPTLLDLLHRVRQQLGSSEPWRVISGYRSPRTNEMLRVRGGGVVQRSLHLYGMAVDVSLPGRDLSMLRRVAIAQQRGGVGYYPDSGFVHVDVGRVRTW
jgi:uncharacterized protein YcbK (DUF882 family)